MLTAQPRSMAWVHAGSPLTVGDQAVAGVGAGLAAAAIACPTELIKCRLQAQAGARINPVSHAPLGLAVALPGTTPGAVQLVNFEVWCQLTKSDTVKTLLQSPVF